MRTNLVADVESSSAKPWTSISRADEQKLTMLVTQYHRGMLRFAQSMVGPALAEEVVQDAWINIWQGLESFQGRSRIKTWLFRIVANQAITELRRQGRMPETITNVFNDDYLDECFDDDGSWSVPPARWGTEETPEAWLACDELQALISGTVQAMPTRRHAVFILRDVEGLDYDQIAETLTMSIGNVRVCLHRARAQIWATVEQYRQAKSK